MLAFLEILKPKDNDIEQYDKFGQSRLLRVCSSRSVGQFLTQEERIQAQELIKKGADIFAYNKCGNNYPLRSLVAREEKEFVVKLFAQWLQRNPRKWELAKSKIGDLSKDHILLGQDKQIEIKEKLNSLTAVLSGSNNNTVNEETDLDLSSNEESKPLLTDKNNGSLQKRHVRN